MSLRHAGMHWPTGGENPGRNTIYDLPGVRDGGLIMLADSARYWYDEARNRSPLVIWRGLPQQGKLPAQLGWDPKKVAAECMNLWDEQPHGGELEYFVPLNELQFPFESGHSTFPGFRYVADKLGLLRVELRKRLPSNVRLVWPAWGPDQPYMDAPFDAWEDWIFEARQWDVISAHVYSHKDGDPNHFGAANVKRTHDWYRPTFFNQPLVYTEWNSNSTGKVDREMLAAMAEICAKDPFCLGFMYYIWQTLRDGERQLSVWGNTTRYNLFLDPPTFEEQPKEPEVPVTLPTGLDVASYQGYPDWQAVAADGHTFAFTKATEDTDYVNSTFAHNWKGIKDAGMIRGVYHFARPEGVDAVAEADYCLAVVADNGGWEEGDLLALDLEAGSGDLGPWVLAFLRRCEEVGGIKPLVYTGAWFSGPHNLAAYPEIGEYGLWLAAYQAEMPAPPAPWNTIAFWQYTSNGRVSGIQGDVDMNVFNGPADRIKLYGKQPKEPDQPVEPSQYTVGAGILAKMAETGDRPATNEAYYGQEYSEAFGQGGSRYVYLKSTNLTYRFDPDS